jgi:drug/metabolite transporter (DMT)-like permease
MRVDRLHPVLISIFGIAILCGMDALIKLISPRFSTFELVFLRFAFGTSFALALWCAVRPALPTREAIRTNILRGSIVAISATSFFYALQTIPLAEAVAFSFLSPLFLALFGALILGEKIGRNTMIGLATGFFGMLVMLGGQGFSGTVLHIPGALAAIGSAVTYAFSLVLLRQRAQRDALVTIVLFQNIVPGVIVATPALMNWTMPGSMDLLILVILGAMGVGGHYLLGMAFRRAEASKLAVAEYSALIFATLLGLLFFNEIPGLATFAGTLLIVAGTLIALRTPVKIDEPAVEPAP